MADDWKLAQRNWAALWMFVVTGAIVVTLVPWYGLTHGYHTSTWVWFVVILSLNELSITCGYHRLFAHVTYEARPALKVIYLLFGAMALQNSALLWSAGHRVHHRHIDDPERDPYCARRGFWFAHIGWMLRNYPSGNPDLSTVRELQRDPLVMWQHRNYLMLALIMNFGVPLIIGWASGDLVGVLLIVGVLRLVVSHHLTFCINSLAHMVGIQPYTDGNTARDNAVVALLTFGEGYHNFHHMFAHDYRNGVRWWQWDPSKWLIYSMRWVGLTGELKRVPWFKIQRAKLDNQFKHAERRIALQTGGAHIELLKKRISEEYETFREAVNRWTHLREKLIEARRAMVERWERTLMQARLKEIERGLRLQSRRVRALSAQLG